MTVCSRILSQWIFQHEAALLLRNGRSYGSHVCRPLLLILRNWTSLEKDRGHKMEYCLYWGLSLPEVMSGSRTLGNIFQYETVSYAKNAYIIHNMTMFCIIWRLNALYNEHGKASQIENWNLISEVLPNVNSVPAQYIMRVTITSVPYRDIEDRMLCKLLDHIGKLQPEKMWGLDFSLIKSL